MEINKIENKCAVRRPKKSRVDSLKRQNRQTSGKTDQGKKKKKRYK